MCFVFKIIWLIAGIIIFPVGYIGFSINNICYYKISFKRSNNIIVKSWKESFLF